MKKRRSYPKSANKNIRLYFNPKDETLQDFGTKDLDGIKIKIKTIIEIVVPVTFFFFLLGVTFSTFSSIKNIASKNYI